MTDRPGEDGGRRGDTDRGRADDSGGDPADRGRSAARSFARQRAGGGGRRGRPAAPPRTPRPVGRFAFTRQELLDLGVAWVALGLAFTFFLFDPGVVFSGAFLPSIALSMATVGVAFLVHELAHKVVAVRFGQVAHFQADYGMLVVSVLAGLGGFLFAAPGAVVHAGSITDRENGLIALAGPAANVALMAVFAVFLAVPGLGPVGRLGVLINAALAAFNLIPFGPLDGRTVLTWSKAVWVLSFAVSVALVGAALLSGLASGLF